MASAVEPDITALVELPLPPPLASSLFLDPDFDPSTFLLERRHTPLDELRSELRAYLATLRTSLVAVINEEYESFIGLSLGLRQAAVSNSLATIRRPVLNIRNEVLLVKETLEEMREEMEGVLEIRKSVREGKAVLRRLLEVEEAVEKVETLLMIGEGSIRATKGRDLDHVVDSPAKRIERIAGEYNQMLYLVDKAGDLPFVISLQPRIDRITSTLSLDLASLLTVTLSTPPPTSALPSPSLSISPTASTSAPSPTSKRDSLTSILRTYASLGLTTTAQELIRKLVVRPFVTKMIHREVLNAPISPGQRNIPLPPIDSTLEPPTTNGFSTEKTTDFYNLEPIGHMARKLSDQGSAGELEPLAELYNKLLSFLSNECAMILDVAERTLAVPTIGNGSIAAVFLGGEKKKVKLGGVGYELLTSVVWDEIASRLMSELGHVIFAAGQPSVFHRNYSLTLAFISRLEEICPSLQSLDTFRTHPTTLTFLKRFQLPVYFQLRFKEIVTTVEQVLRSSTELSQSAEGSTFLMSESAVIGKALEKCWSEDVFLAELSGRFWKLTLQLLSRYRTWSVSVTPRAQSSLFSSASTSNLSGLAAGTASTRASFDNGNRNQLGVATSSTRPGTPAPEEVSDETTLRSLTLLIADSRRMETKVTALFADGISKLLPTEQEEDGASARAVLQNSLANLVAPIPSLASSILAILIARSLDHLKHVKSVANQARASTKQSPTEPSYFVRLILRDLKLYLKGVGSHIEDDMLKGWKSEVVDAVALKYTGILLRQKETDESLRRLKKGNRQGGALSFFGRSAASSATPEETSSVEDSKVTLQMQLDVNAFGAEAVEMEVDIEQSAPFAGLRNVVNGVAVVN